MTLRSTNKNDMIWKTVLRRKEMEHENGEKSQEKLRVWN